MHQPSPDVSIVIPCLNEAGTLPECVGEAREALAVLRQDHGLSGEILVADNGSDDGSQTIATGLGARVVGVTERGYGGALIGGILAARGRYIVMGDADCSYDFRESVGMVTKLRDGFELCMGSRLKGTILPGAMPWKNRYIGNPVLSGILNLLFRSGLSDAHCGLRAFTKDAFERMRLSATGMEFASEMVIKAKLVGLRCTEVPITLRPDKRGRPPHLRPWRDGWRHLRYLFMLSPAWLFFVPSALFALVGLTLALALVLNADAQMIAIGPFLFGDHWMVVSGSLLVMAQQTAIFGLATTLYGLGQGYRKAGPGLTWLLRFARLEYMLLTGLAVMTLGASLFLYIVIAWSQTGFGPLSMLREVVAAMTLVLIGVQGFFGGFLLSIVGGNVARVERVAVGQSEQDENRDDDQKTPLSDQPPAVATRRP